MQPAIRFNLLITLAATCFFIMGNAQTTPPVFTAADTLRGSLNADRQWWDVKRYDLEITPDYATKTIEGRNTIKFTGNTGNVMQIDLQQPLIIDSITFMGRKCSFERKGNIALAYLPSSFADMQRQEYFISIYYHGKPREAKRPPWDGGWIWAKDAEGRPWMTVACQGIGASVWYPCKDHQSDEPDEGASITIITPHELMGIGNGKLISSIEKGEKAAHRWEVRSPINSYNLVPYIGAYRQWEENFSGEDGRLALSYWVLDYNVNKARQQFTQVPEMLRCFEYWMGPYPFYEDGFKLVESPHLGMEHQSNIAYGNQFQNGYRGRDLSGTGWGNLWDFIIIHESGHEWFGNNISTRDIADMWVHEGFTNYTEVLFTQCKSGREAAMEYARGLRRNILNDRPVQGYFGVNKSGSGDMYYKGSNMIHTIRTMMDDDTAFRAMLRGMNKSFFRQTITGSQVEDFIKTHTGFGEKLTPFFDQYLRNISIPVLEWKVKNGLLSARFTACVPGFQLKVWMPTAGGAGQWKWIGTQWESIHTTLSEAMLENEWNPNLYIQYRAVNP